MTISDNERLIFGIVLAVSAVLLAALIFAVRSGHLFHVDQMVLTSLHKMKSPLWDNFFSALTWLGSLWILLPLYIVVVLSLSGRFLAVEKMMGIGFFGAVITTYVIKYMMERKRPHFFSTINELPIDPAFPSAHTTQIVAFTLLLWLIIYSGPTLFNVVFSLILVVVASAVALSRMYLQVHYPTDVAAGALVALIWTSIAVIAVKTGGKG